MADSNPQNLVENRTLKFGTKGPLQRSPRDSPVGYDVIHRQIAFSKVLLDVAERISNVPVFHGQGLGALSGYDPFGCDSLGYIRWGLAIHQPIEERCRFVCHPLEIVADA